jgi:dTDP-4-dehydrorhamnose reductase
LGVALCETLAKKGEQIAGTFLTFRPGLTGPELHKADVSTAEPAVLVRRLRPARVFHLAWSTNLDECELRPELAYAPARAGMKALIEACQETGSHLIFMSSDGVFGDPAEPRFEDSVPVPINHYGRGKVEAEAVLRGSQIRWSVLRACPIGYNPRRDKGLVNWAIASLRAGKTVTGFADSSFTPLSVGTLAREVARIGPGHSGQILHFLSDPPISKFEFLLAIARQLALPESKIVAGSLASGKFAAPRPSRQDLQTREPATRVFDFASELKLAIFE